MLVLYELFDVSLKGFAVLGFVPILFVVGTELVLISGGRVTFYLLRPLEEELRLDLAEELADRLLEYRVYSFVSGGLTSCCPPRWGPRPLPRWTGPCADLTAPFWRISHPSWTACFPGRRQNSPSLEPRLLLL